MEAPSLAQPKTPLKAPVQISTSHALHIDSLLHRRNTTFSDLFRVHSVLATNIPQHHRPPQTDRGGESVPSIASRHEIVRTNKFP